MPKTPAKTAASVSAKAPAAKTKPAPEGQDKHRRVKVRTYKSFRLEKKVKRGLGPTLPSGYRIFRAALGLMKRNWKVLLGIAAINGLLTLVFISGFSAINLTDAKQSFGSLFDGQLNQAATGLSLFVYLLGSSGNTTATPTSGVYQVLIGVVISLAAVWTLRQIYAGNKVRIRDGFYQGMYPFVQFVLVLVVIGLQLLPLIGGAEIYQLVINNAIAVTAIEHILWLVLFLLLGVLSLYMVCASFFALYIVSLPDVTPLAALQSARRLVLHRRWLIIRKVLFLPLALLVVTAVVTVPFILFAPAVAPWIFFALSSVVLVLLHCYMYTLYKAML